MRKSHSEKQQRMDDIRIRKLGQKRKYSRFANEKRFYTSWKNRHRSIGKNQPVWISPFMRSRLMTRPVQSRKSSRNLPQSEPMTSVIVSSSSGIWLIAILTHMMTSRLIWFSPPSRNSSVWQKENSRKREKHRNPSLPYNKNRGIPDEKTLAAFRMPHHWPRQPCRFHILAALPDV